jgi:hypothetical protein
MHFMKLTWDESAGKYRRSDGRVVTAREVRLALDRDLLVLRNEAARLTERMRTGELAIDVWRAELRTLIKQTHLTSTAIAAGGRSQVSQAEWGLAGQIIREEYGHLDGWVVDILNGDAPLDGRMQSRAQLYAEAGRNSFHEAERRDQQQRGMDLEKSVLHPAEHCWQCLAEAEAGFRPIGEMVPIGSRECGRRCRCTVVYARAAA